jgi:hypothetical protein
VVGAIGVVVVALAGGVWQIASRDAGGDVVTDGDRPAALPATNTSNPSATPPIPAATDETTPTTSMPPPSTAAGVLRPFLDPQLCGATSARLSTTHDDTLFLFARSREVPVPIQVFGDPAGGPTAPFAVVERFFSSDITHGQLDPVEINGVTVGVAVYSNGNGEAAWELPDGSHVYLRARGLERVAIEVLIGRLTPRDPTAAIVGFDYQPDATTPSMQLVTEHLNTGISGRAALLECTVPTTGYSYRISVLDGDPVFEYGGVIDRPVPLHVGRNGDAIIVISGPADPSAPTPADVTTADADEWRDLLAAPTEIERAAGQAPTGGLPESSTTTPHTTANSTWLDTDGDALIGRWTDGRNTFEFSSDGVARFTYQASCDGSYAVQDGVITVDFGACGADAVNLSSPIFRSAKVYATANDDAIIVDGDAGMTRLERVP